MHTKILHLSNSHISPHVRMCISHTYSLIMSVCLHVTQRKAPCTCLSLSSTDRDTKNLITASVSTHIRHACYLSLAHTLNKGFPVNNLLSIHQQSWQYGEHETWKRTKLHVRRPPSMTTRTRASRKRATVTPSLSVTGKPLFYTVKKSLC